jgi:hypothetical protein
LKNNCAHDEQRGRRNRESSVDEEPDNNSISSDDREEDEDIQQEKNEESTNDHAGDNDETMIRMVTMMSLTIHTRRRLFRLSHDGCRLWEFDCSAALASLCKLLDEQHNANFNANAKIAFSHGAAPQIINFAKMMQTILDRKFDPNHSAIGLSRLCIAMSL